MWSEILLIICSLISIGILLFYSGKNYLHLRCFLSISLICIIASISASFFFSEFETEIKEWTKVTGISFALVVIAILIREMKPTYVRYPVIFSYVPLAIIAVYPFISDAEILKNLLNQLLQGGAIAVSLLLYVSLKDKLEKHYLFIIGMLLFATAFGFYWFGGEYSSEMMIWTWQLPMAAGIILTGMQSSELFTRLNP